MDGINDRLDSEYGHEIETNFSKIATDFSGLSGKFAEDFGMGAPYISYVQVNACKIITDADAYPLVNVSESENQSIVRWGDLIVTLSSETPSEVAVCSSYLGSVSPLCLNSFCFGLRFKPSKNIYPPYFGYFTSSTRFRKFVYPLAQGSTRYNLHKQDFMSRKFSIPSVKRQQDIFKLLNLYSDKLKVEVIFLNYLLTQKRFLLSKMFI